MDMEYRNYRRKEVQKHSLHLLIVLYIVLILLLCFDLNKKVRDETWLFQFVLLIQGIITLFMTIGYLITRQKLYFADLLGPCLLISLVVGLLIVNLSDIYEDLGVETIYVQSFMVFFYYFIYLGLLSVRFLKNFIIR